MNYSGGYLCPSIDGTKVFAHVNKKSFNFFGAKTAESLCESEKKKGGGIMYRNGGYMALLRFTMGRTKILPAIVH